MYKGIVIFIQQNQSFSFYYQQQRSQMKKVKKDQTKSKKIEVAVRMRPLLYNFQDQPAWLIDKKTKSITSIPKQNILKSNNSSEYLPLKRKYSDSLCNYSFNFDYVFDYDSTNYQIFQKSCSRIVDGFLQGSNCTIFMYGQTTSGKTYTMLGDQKYQGIITYSLSDIFKKFCILNQKDNKYEIFISYLEIYNEQINDLLNPGSLNLKIQQDTIYGISVQGLRQCKINSFQQAQQLLLIGQQQRSYKQKNYHDHSSRSHTIFQIKIHEIGDIKAKCLLNLVDLAGSQRLQDEQKMNQSSQQTGYINKSLFVLSNVINKLAKCKKNAHIPFRDSKLTRLLSNSLNGNSFTMIICTLSPAAMNFYQTLSTLRFATNAKKVETKPVIIQQQIFQKQNIKDILQKKNREYQSLKLQNQQLKKLIKQSQKKEQLMKQKIEQIREQSLLLKKNSKQQQREQFLSKNKENLQQLLGSVTRTNKQWQQKSKNLCQQFQRNINVLKRKYRLALFNIAESSFPDSKFQLKLYFNGKNAQQIFDKIIKKQIFNDIVVSGILNTQNEKQVTLEELEYAQNDAKRLLLERFIEIKKFVCKQKMESLLGILQRQFSQKTNIIDMAFKEVQRYKIGECL